MTDRTGHSDCQQSLGAGIWVEGLLCVSISVDLSGYAMVDKTTWIHTTLNKSAEKGD